MSERDGRPMLTGELAKLLGLSPNTLRKWKKRGDIPDAPQGKSGQGRGNECSWSPLAQQQARDRRDEQRRAGRKAKQ
jgi:uncharacterized protein YjcR